MGFVCFRKLEKVHYVVLSYCRIKNSNTRNMRGKVQNLVFSAYLKTFKKLLVLENGEKLRNF